MKKQFNLEAALNGDPFKCEDGSQVLKWMYCDEVGTYYPITCYIKRHNGNISIHCFTKDGFFKSSKQEHDLNLVMSPKKVTRWFNVYESTKDGFILGGYQGFETEEEASNIVFSVSKGYITTIPIEIEMP
jgi:hypothetical protein